MYPFTFIVTYLTFENEERKACGVLFADNYGEAAAKLEKEFRDDLLSVDRLYAMEEKNVIEFNDVHGVSKFDIIDSVENYN